MKIVRARPADAAALTEIAFAAKRHWGYSEEWMDHWKKLLTIEPDFLAKHETYAAMAPEGPIGFYSLCFKGGKLRLEHLWVRPDRMRLGIGRALFTHAVGQARELGFHALEIESDPNAEGFYVRMGARRVGSQVAELEGERRELPVLLYEILPVV
jgi:GNAT superfamily N-acetyltransferase